MPRANTPPSTPPGRTYGWADVVDGLGVNVGMTLITSTGAESQALLIETSPIR